jgi:hypothetical protein
MAKTLTIIDLSIVVSVFFVAENVPIGIKTPFFPTIEIVCCEMGVF